MNQTDEQREQIILETSRTVSAVRDNNAGMRGEMPDFEEWGQSVRMFSNKVKEVQSKFSEFDCSHAGLESRLESQRSSLRSTSCRDSPTSSADESVMILDEYSPIFQLHLAWPQLWDLGPWDLRVVRVTAWSGASGIEASASLELSSASRRLNADPGYGLAPMRGLDVNVGCRPGRLNWAQADQHLALVEITCCLDRLFETYDGNVHV